jgi:conjugal transfer mating pair stabilization protein TraG
MYEIYSWGNNNALYLVFNGIASIMNGGDYMDLIKVIALLAMMAAVIGGLMTGRFTGFNWFIGLVMVYGLMFVPKANVVVVDRLNINPPVTIGNVPLGLAFFGHVTSKIGDYLTTAFETVFAMPGPVRYSGHGVLFGNKMILSARQQTPTNPSIRKDLNNFIRNCTYYDIKDGRITLDQLVKSTNLWQTMSATSTARTTTIDAWNFPITCSWAYWWISYEMYNNEVPTVAQQYGTMTYPNITNATLAAATYTSDLPTVYQTMLGVASNATDIIEQNMVMNAMSDSSMVLAEELNDPAAASLALSVAQTEAVANSNYQTMAKVAADALPKIRNVMEVVIISVFPFVFLLFLLPVNTAMTALKGYIFTLLWIQLWPPLYAVLNLVMTNASALSMSADTAGNFGYCLLAVQKITQTGLSDLAISGFLVFSIPAISWAIIRGGGEMLGSVVGNISAPIASAAGAAAQSVGTGNLSYGTLNYQTENAFNRTMHKDRTAYEWEDPGMHTIIRGSGTSVFGSDGARYDADRVPQLAVKPNLSTSSARSHEISSQTAFSSGLTEVANYAQTHLRGTHSAFQWDVTHNAADEKLASARQEIHDKLTHTFGKDFADRNTDAMMYYGVAEMDMRTPKALKAVTGLEGKLSAGVRNQNTSEQSEDYKKALLVAHDVLKNHGLDTSQKVAETFQKSSAYKQLRAQDRKLAEALDAKFTEGKTESEVAKRMEQLSYGANADVSKAVQDALDKLGVSQEERVQHPERYVPVANSVVERLAIQQVATTMRLPQPQYDEEGMRHDFNENKSRVRQAADDGGVKPEAPPDATKRQVEAEQARIMTIVKNRESKMGQRTSEADAESSQIEGQVTSKTENTEKYGTGFSGTFNRWFGRERKK